MYWQEILTAIIVILATAGVYSELRKTFSKKATGCGTCSSCPSAGTLQELPLVDLEVSPVNSNEMGD